MPIIDVVGGLGPRQNRVLTQTITYPQTTFVTTVTLADWAASTTVPTVGAAATQSSAASTPVTPTGTSAPTSDQLGAILGTIFGVLFMLGLCWYCCCVPPKRRRRTRYVRGDTDSDASSFVPEVRVRADPRWPFRYPAQPMPTHSRPVLVPHPPLFPPTRPTPGYRQTRHPQIRGVHMYP